MNESRSPDALALPDAGVVRQGRADFARNLRRLIRERGTTQAELARQVGCSQGYLSQLANERRLDKTPSGDLIVALAHVLGGTVGQLYAPARVTPGTLAQQLELLEERLSAQQRQELLHLAQFMAQR